MSIASFGPEAVVYDDGTLARNAELSVVIVGTDTLIPLYASADGSIALPNPVSTDGDGNLFFYADDGEYEIMFGGSRVSIATNPRGPQGTITPELQALADAAALSAVDADASAQIATAQAVASATYAQDADTAAALSATQAGNAATSAGEAAASAASIAGDAQAAADSADAAAASAQLLAGRTPLYVQDDQPAVAGQYVWFDTSDGDLQILVEDGL